MRCKNCAQGNDSGTYQSESLVQTALGGESLNRAQHDLSSHSVRCQTAWSGRSRRLPAGMWAWLSPAGELCPARPLCLGAWELRLPGGSRLNPDRRAYRPYSTAAKPSTPVSWRVEDGTSCRPAQCYCLCSQCHDSLQMV